MKSWKIGIVGAGLIADFHAKAIGDIENATLVGVCDSGSGSGKKLANRYNCEYFEDYKKLIASESVEIITIATPSGFHLEPTLFAARHKKHVLCEKPIEITTERIDLMIEAHEKSGTYLGCIFPYRYIKSSEVIKKAITDGRFGTITYASVNIPWWREETYYSKSNWHGTWKLDGGGALMNQSIHMIDTLIHLMGPVKKVLAFADSIGHDIETEDTAVAILQFENNALGTIYGSTAAYPGQFRQLEIRGTKGSVVQIEDSISSWQFADETPEDEKIRKEFSKIDGGGGVADPAAIPYETHTKNFQAFLHAIEKNAPYEINGYEAKKSVELIQNIYKSAGLRG
ncbi:Gfo/Idh/MocA family oxidoreductase [Flavobacteriaceae bacterium MHTCC 0001]